MLSTAFALSAILLAAVPAQGQIVVGQSPPVNAAPAAPLPTPLPTVGPAEMPVVLPSSSSSSASSSSAPPSSVRPCNRYGGDADAISERTVPFAPCLSASRRALAIAAAIFPGVIVHGAGAWVAKRPVTARRLLTAQGVGLGVIAAGGVPIIATYGSPKVVVPGVQLIVTGVGMVAAGWLGDLWAAADGDVGAGVPRAELARYVDAGASWARDPYYGNRGYLELGAGAWWRNLAFEPRARLELLARSGEGGLDVRWLLWGAPADGRVLGSGHRPSHRRGPEAATEAAHDAEPALGHRLELRLGAFGRFDRDDDGAALWQEVELAGRLELRVLDDALAGLFLDAGVGLALEETRYPTAVWDVGALILARNAIGVYLGRGGGEVSISYDHRRDDLVGGFFAGRAAGFLGHLGAHLQLRLGRGLALRADVELGTALLSTLALRFGGP